MQTGPAGVLDEPVSDEELGSVILEALAASQHEVPAPKRFTVVNAPVLKAVGVRSQLALMKGMRHVDVQRKAGMIALYPNENRGRGGFVQIEGGEYPVEPRLTEDPAAPGAAARRALSVATLGE